MNIQIAKIELVKMILNIDNYEFIQEVAAFIKKNKKTDFWHDLNLSKQKEIKEII